MNSLKKAMTNPTLNPLVLGDTIISYTVIRKRKQNISFRFFDLTLVVYAPYEKSIQQIEEALRSKTRWILRHYANRQTYALAKNQIHVLGEVVTVRFVVGDAQLVQLNDHVLTITHRTSSSEKAALSKVLASIAKQEITTIFLECCQEAGIAPKQMEFKNLRSSLGRCSSTKNIVLAQRLIHYPREVIRAVCYHELAHLVHMNHSQRFYKQLESWMPEYRQVMKNARNYPSVSTID